MDGSAIQQRWSRVRAALDAEAADWLVVGASADFRWLTGAVARATERLVAFALPRAGEPFVVIPRLEAEALSHECPGLELEVWDEDQDPLERLAHRIGLSRQPNVLVGEGLRVTALLQLAAAARCRPAATALAPLRAVKDAEEIAYLEAAAAHADRIIEEVADAIRPGMTERRIAREALERFEAEGDTDPWAIVASGPNAALPHHFTSDRRLEAGDVVLLDVGASTSGYGSDITRTYWLGPPSAEAEKLFAVVDQAREAGIAASRPGVACEAVDGAARNIIARAGYAEYFVHRTGHGVGLEVHEPPYLMRGNHAPLEAGMVHSVEPGIYVPGRFGVRIEDLVVVEAEGARRLNQAPRDLRLPHLRD